MKKLIAALMFGTCAFAATSLFAEAKYGYVDNGLIAHWDAIDNQATGTHVGDATTWVDLVGNQAFQLSGTTWDDLCLKFAGTTSSFATLTGDDALAIFDYTNESTTRTVELVFKYDTAISDGVLIMGTAHSNIGIGRWHGGSRVIYQVASGLTEATEPGDGFYTISACYVKSYIQVGPTRQDNEAVSLTKGYNYWSNADDATITLGKTTKGTSYCFAGSLYAIRVYDRQLTEDEATQNYTVDQQRFNREKALTVVSGSVTVGEQTFAAGETVYFPTGETALSIASATDAEVQPHPALASLSVASGTVALDATCAWRLKIDALNLGATAVLKLPEKGLRVGTTLTTEAGAIVKGPGKLYGPEETCSAELQDGAEYASLTAGLNGYVDGGELIAYWDAIDNQATGTHDASKSTWKDLIFGKTFTRESTGAGVWQDRSLLFDKDKFGPYMSDTFLNAAAGDTTRMVEITFKTAESADGTMVLLADGGSHKIMIVRDNAGMRATKSSRKPYPAITDGAFTGISYGYVNEVPQDDAAYHNGTAVAPQEGADAVSSDYTNEPVRLGYRSGYGNCWYYYGEIYAIRVYDRLLTAAEVAQNRQCDVDRFTMHPAATVKSGSVTVDGRTFAAGEQVLVPLEETEELVIESAADADIVLEHGFVDLELETGSLVLSAVDPALCVELGDLTLGADASLKLPPAGLAVSGTITADETAVVRGPGLLIGEPDHPPVKLTDGAIYVSVHGWTGWPDSGVAYIPANTEAPITAADVAKIANLEKIVFLADTSKVTYELSDAFELTTPVEGPGTFAFTSAGDVTISADNSLLTGAFFFTNTTVLVAHENGLGAALAQTCHFWPGSEGDYGHTLDFDNGESVFTNRVALYLHPLATKSIIFGAISSDKTLVQDADFYFARYNTNQDYMNPRFKSTVKFLRHFEYFPSAWTQYPYSSVTSGGEGVWFMGEFALKNTGIWYVNSGVYHLGLSSVDSTVQFSPYTPAEVVCEAENILGNMTLKPFQSKSLFDLNGYNQDCLTLCLYTGSGSTSKTTGDPMIRFTSATPAAFRITGNDTYDINPTFSGAAGFTMAGTGAYGLYGVGGWDTTGELKVEKGTLSLCTDFSWGGTNVTVQGGTLLIAADAANRCLNRQADLVVAAAGATLEIEEGRTETVRSLKVGDGYISAGIYGGPESSAAHKLDCLAGRGLLRVRWDAPDKPAGVLLLVR